MTTPTTLPPDLVDGDGDLNLVVGYGTDGEPRYHLTSMSEGDEPDQEWVERRRLAYRADLDPGELDDMQTRRRVESTYGIRRDRPRAMRYDWDPTAEPTPVPEPAPEPEGRVTGAGGFALDDDGLPVDPGPDHPEEERLRAIQARTETVQARHEQFRREVRTEVLASQDRHGWCAPGTSRVLEDLGLDKINAVRRVTATVSFEISGTNSDQNATTFARNKIDRAIREALGDRLRGDLSVDPGRVVVTRHED